MAEMTIPIGTVSDESGQARLEMDVDDTSDPANWTVIRFRCVNQMSRPVFVDVQRGSSASFWTRSVAAGESVTQNTGGPVRRAADVPYMLLRTT